MTTFETGDKVVAKLWPELGTGEVMSLTKDQNSIAARVAAVHWPDADQTSSHSFVALKLADQEPAAQPLREAYDIGFNIVNQLADLWNVPVDVRQATNDRCWDFAAELVATAAPRLHVDRDALAAAVHHRFCLDRSAPTHDPDTSDYDKSDEILEILALIGVDAQ